ncbi:filamentous hemagglutinin N-terminal domain-containing protein [Diaphorobacter ruginosibacter]|uniref:filamentous hemagglutinin N-terminal domain-containing protein n=1 Tax=Diaphorobacter ruginosibacter TaxID=1715720 RepID=UPI00333E5746
MAADIMKPLSIAVLAALAHGAMAQNVVTAVVPNGQTATAVTMDDAGRAHVNPAAAQHGVSYNSFSQFDVGRPGLTFENQGVNARTIVGEVFSASPSRISGEIDVNGPRANLILANQNGISVNGGSFVNFGSVALTTGALTLRDEIQGSGLTQRYVDVATARGGIDIGEQGLAGNLIRLEMIAKEVAINGPVTNEFTSSTALVRVVAGESRATFDTAASPVDNLTPWVYYEAGEASRSDFAVKVGAGSRVTSGRIEILVTDKGAGVMNEGELVASAGDFTLSATGDVLQLGGQMRALGSVNIQAADVVLQNGDGRDSIVSAGQQVNMQASGSIRNIGGEITGGQRVSDENPFAVLLKADGDIENRTPIGAEKTALIFGQGDSVRLEAGGDITSANARIMSNGGLQVQAQGAVVNESVHVQGDDAQAWDGSSVFTRKSGYETDMGSLADPANLGYWVAQGDIDIQAAEFANRGAFIYSNEGSIEARTAGSFTNEAHGIGQYGYSKRCVLFVCKTTAHTSESLVGGQIMAATDIKVDAGGTVLNYGGTMYAGQGMEVTAPLIVARAKPLHTVILRDKGLKALFGDTWAQVYATDQGGGFTAQQGSLMLRGVAQQDGGSFIASEGVDGDVTVIRAPHRDPVRIEDHLGILWW